MAISNISWRRKGIQQLVTIARDNAEPLQVQIGKYTKVITAKQQTINLTPYLREEIMRQPSISGKFTDSDAAVPVEIVIDGHIYNSGVAYALGEDANIQHCASDLPYRVIAHGQTDAISLFIGQNNSAEVESDYAMISEYSNSGIGSLYAFKVQPSHSHLYVSRLGDSAFSHKIHYIYRPMGLNGKRMAWLNRYGALDFWNFDFLREQSFGATAETIYTHNGYQKIARTAEKVFVMETREATREALDALSFIIASPAVWIVNDDLTGYPTFEEVDVITEECKVFDSKEMIGLQIAYRPKQRVL